MLVSIVSQTSMHHDVRIFLMDHGVQVQILIITHSLELVAGKMLCHEEKKSAGFSIYVQISNKKNFPSLIDAVS